MHSFDPDIAQRVGVNAAVIYQNIFWWTKKNAANGKHIKDGYVWTFNSRTAFAKLFPYLTVSQIKTALLKLCDSGLIVKGEYNALGLDRTNWYAPTESANWIAGAIGQKSPIDWSEKANGLVTEGQPIPVVNTDIKPDEVFGAKAPKQRKPEMDLPDGWVPNDKNVQDAIDRGFSATEIENEADRFANHHRSKQNRFRDWDAAWRTWLGNARKFGTTQRGKGGARSGMAEAFASVAADCAARERNRAENPERTDDFSLWGVDLS